MLVPVLAEAMKIANALDAKRSLASASHSCRSIADDLSVSRINR